MIEEIKIKKLKLLEKNPRRISKGQMIKLQESLIQDPDFLNSRPVLVNRVDGINIVYGGNQRVRAAKALGWEAITCSVSENLDESRMKSRVIKDNQTFGEFDFEILANEWDLDILIESGMTQEMLQVDAEIIKDLEKEEEKEKKMTVCPVCSHEF